MKAFDMMSVTLRRKNGIASKVILIFLIFFFFFVAMVKLIFGRHWENVYQLFISTVTILFIIILVAIVWDNLKSFQVGFFQNLRVPLF